MGIVGSRMWRRILSVALWEVPKIDRPGLYVPAAFLLSCWIWWELSAPLPGYCIGVLALEAVIMTVRSDKFTLGERVLWVCIGAALLCGEMSVVNRDRKAGDQQASADRSDQIDRFKATTLGLEKAIKGIDATLRQTSPRASLTVLSFGFAEPTNPIRWDTSYPFNMELVDRGNDSATITKEMFSIYTGKPDDKSAQEVLVEEFEKEWKAQKNSAVPQPSLFVDVPYIVTRFKSFTRAEIDSMGPDKRTIYFLVRIEYSDSSGRWGMEDCRAFQNGPGAPINPAMLHYCQVFRNPRYPIKPQR